MDFHILSFLVSKFLQHGWFVIWCCEQVGFVLFNFVIDFLFSSFFFIFFLVYFICFNISVFIYFANFNNNLDILYCEKPYVCLQIC